MIINDKKPGLNTIFKNGLIILLSKKVYNSTSLEKFTRILYTIDIKILNLKRRYLYLTKTYINSFLSENILIRLTKKNQLTKQYIT